MKVSEHFLNASNGEQRIDVINGELFHIVYVQKRTMSAITLGSKEDCNAEERKALIFVQEYLDCISEKDAPAIEIKTAENITDNSTHGNNNNTIASDPSGIQSPEKSAI